MGFFTDKIGIENDNYGSDLEFGSDDEDAYSYDSSSGSDMSSDDEEGDIVPSYPVLQPVELPPMGPRMTVQPVELPPPMQPRMIVQPQMPPRTTVQPQMPPRTTVQPQMPPRMTVQPMGYNMEPMQPRTTVEPVGYVLIDIWSPVDLKKRPGAKIVYEQDITPESYSNDIEVQYNIPRKKKLSYYRELDESFKLKHGNIASDTLNRLSKCYVNSIDTGCEYMSDIQAFV